MRSAGGAGYASGLRLGRDDLLFGGIAGVNGQVGGGNVGGRVTGEKDHDVFQVVVIGHAAKERSPLRQRLNTEVGQPMPLFGAAILRSPIY